MKDFHPAITIIIALPAWVYDYVDASEWPSMLNESDGLWLFLLCYEARNNP